MGSKNNQIAFFEISKRSYSRRISRYKTIYYYNGIHYGGAKLPHDFLNRIDIHLADYKAGQEIEWVFNEYTNDLETRVLNEVMDDERGQLFLKKTVLLELGKIFTSFELGKKVLEYYNIEEPVDFVPTEFSLEILKIAFKKKELFPEYLHIPSWYMKRIKFKEVTKRYAYNLFLRFYPIIFSLKMKRLKNEKPDIQRFKYGLHVFNTGIHHYTPPYSMEFLRGNNHINEQDILYIIDGNMSEENFKKIKNTGRSYCYFTEMINEHRAGDYFRGTYIEALKIREKLLSVNAQKALILLIYCKTLMNFIMWHLFFKRFRVDQFITAQEPGDISRVLFQKMQGSTHSFIFLNSSYDVAYRDDMDGLADSNFSFMVYDQLITSKVSIDYFKKNGNEIGEYLENGILPSDSAFKVKNDPVLKKEMMKELGIPDDKIIISFFDVSMGKEHMLTFEEAFELIQCIDRLLNSNEDYFFIYKSRALHHLLEGSEVKEAFKNFINEERVLFVNEIPLEYISTHYMGLSDLVISCYASSVGLEAVSGGIKAIYYTPKRFYKNAFRIINFPKYCACGYDQLKEYTDYWLNHCTEADFKDFQEKYIKRYIDKYCDGASNNRLETFLLSDIH